MQTILNHLGTTVINHILEMRRYFIISVFALASCGGSGDRGNETAKMPEENINNATILPTSAAPKHYCFLLTEGTRNQDTTTVQFTVNGDSVEGVMNWVPEEKDSRKGILTGNIAGDEIKAMWRYMQEGMKDSMKVAFKLAPSKLTQKPLKVNTATGRQETDQAADYTVKYKECDAKGWSSPTP